MSILFHNRGPARTQPIAQDTERPSLAESINARLQPADTPEAPHTLEGPPIASGLVRDAYGPRQRSAPPPRAAHRTRNTFRIIRAGTRDARTHTEGAEAPTRETPPPPPTPHPETPTPPARWKPRRRRRRPSAAVYAHTTPPPSSPPPPAFAVVRLPTRTALPPVPLGGVGGRATAPVSPRGRGGAPAGNTADADGGRAPRPRLFTF